MQTDKAKEITKWYLYGSNSIPENLVDESLIRPQDAEVTIEIDKNEFMTTGAGRFAIGPQFIIIEKFFNDNELLPGIYNKLEIAKFFGHENKFGWDMQHYNWRDETDDYAERVYLYNSQEYQIHNDAKFVVTVTGEKFINDFATEPREFDDAPDNFDFESNDWKTQLGNGYLQTLVDPSGIGRKVNFDYVGEVTPVAKYDRAAFELDVANKESWYVPGNALTLLPNLLSEINRLSDELFAAGVTKFLDDQNRPILYGTREADVLSQSSFAPLLQNYYENGVVLIGADGADYIVSSFRGSNNQFWGGSGDDTLNGSDGFDEFYGGEDNDLLTGHTKDDTLIGGSGADTLYGDYDNDELYGDEDHDRLDGGSGDDILTGGAGDDWIDGGSSALGIVGGKDVAVYRGAKDEYNISYFQDYITIADTASSRDGTDTLTGVEFAEFLEDPGSSPDKLISLGAGQDISFVIDTTGSMSDDIGTVKARSNELLDAIFNSANGSENARVSVVGYNDPSTKTYLSFTEQPTIAERKAAAKNAIDRLSASGGGDIPEAVNAGLIHSLSGQAGQWRPSASARRIFLFGDAPAKDTHLRSRVLELAADVGIAQGGNRQARSMSISGDVTTQSLAQGLSVSRFDLLSSDAEGNSTTMPVEIFTIVIGNSQSTAEDFAELAGATGGQTFSAGNASEAFDALLEAITTPVEPPVETSPGEMILGTSDRDTLTGTDGDDTIIGLQGRDVLTGGKGRDQFVYESVRDAGDVITDFEVARDKIVVSELLNSVGYRGSNAIADGYISLAQQEKNTIILFDSDGFGGRRGSSLLTVENVGMDELNDPKNLIF